MLREWLFAKLMGSAELEAVISDRLYQNTSLSDVPGHKPYLIYRFGVASSALMGGDVSVKRVQPIQLFVHDVPGDYSRIDTTLALIRSVLESEGDASVMRCQWLEDSEDLTDDEMHTIVRFSRYQLIH